METERKNSKLFLACLAYLVVFLFPPEDHENPIRDSEHAWSSVLHISADRTATSNTALRSCMHKRLPVYDPYVEVHGTERRRKREGEISRDEIIPWEAARLHSCDNPHPRGFSSDDACCALESSDLSLSLLYSLLIYLRCVIQLSSILKKSSEIFCAARMLTHTKELTLQFKTIHKIIYRLDMIFFLGI